MTKDEFVAALSSGVAASVASSMLKLLEKPPGRQPAQSLVASSEWFKSLDDAGRQRVKAIIELSVNDAVGSFLCVLDGVQAIEPPETRGTLKLIHSSAEGDTVLNGEEGEFLHDIFQSMRNDLD